MFLQLSGLRYKVHITVRDDTQTVIWTAINPMSVGKSCNYTDKPSLFFPLPRSAIYRVKQLVADDSVGGSSSAIVLLSKWQISKTLSHIIYRETVS